ncbi:unnamed protein product, partial [Musa acuminata subsp. burmannicoides]
WSPSTSYREATGSFPRRRNWLTTSPTGSPAHPSLAALSPSRTSTAPSRGIFSAAIGRRAISLRSASPRTAAARASIERPAAVLGLCTKSKKPLSPWSAGARWWSGERAAFLSTMVDDVRVRDVFVWRLRDTSSLSRQEKLALCLPGGTTIKTVETTLTEAATDTVTGDSFVGRKRNRDESSTLGKSIDSRRSHAGSWLHIPAEHCSRTSHHIQPRWCNPTSHHLQPRVIFPLSTLLHRTKPESQPPLHHQWTLVEVRSR